MVFMLNCSFDLSSILKLSPNVFEATISHITPVYFSKKQGLPRTKDTFLHIFDTITVPSIPLKVKELAPSTN